MASLKKIGLWSGVGLLVLWQAYQPKPNISENAETEFITTLQPPAAVAQTLKNSCFDCHSNNTRYDWYDYIQPARTVIEQHIADGKEDLNFSTWNSYSDLKKRRLLASMGDEVSEGAMPLKSYLLLHPKAKLTPEEKQQLLDWLNQIQ